MKIKLSSIRLILAVVWNLLKNPKQKVADVILQEEMKNIENQLKGGTK